MSGWRAVPGRYRSRSRLGGCPGGMPPQSRRPRTCRGGRVGITTDAVVALAAVPDVGARPSATRPSPPGAHATIRWSGVAAAGRPQDSCRAPQRDVLVRRPGRPDEHLATRPHHRQFSSRAPDQPQRATPTRVPDGEARPSPLRPAPPVSDRPSRGRSGTAPTPPTRAHRATPTSRHDHRVCRRSNAPAATISGPGLDESAARTGCAFEVDVSGVRRRFHHAHVYVVAVDSGRVGITTTGAHRTRLAFTIANSTITRTDQCFEHLFD
jgi:hypothetical protein